MLPCSRPSVPCVVVALLPIARFAGHLSFVALNVECLGELYIYVFRSTKVLQCCNAATCLAKYTETNDCG